MKEREAIPMEMHEAAPIIRFDAQCRKGIV